MPGTYRSGEPIAELGGTVQGGVTVVMHTPDDLRKVAALCSLAANSEAPIHALYGLFNSSLIPEIAVASPTAQAHWAETEPSDFDHSGRALMVACSFLDNLWRNSGDESSFNAVLTVARPERDMRLDIDVDRPGLVLHPGSLLATLASGPLSVFGWSLGLFSNRGIGGSTRARRIMEDFRTKAGNKGGAQPLERLDNLPSDYLRGKTALIVLMHGLLSTDVGLFDPLLHRLRADDGFENCAIVGWPHNTLAGIRENAVELLPAFARAIGIDGPDIAFVCHSRGGLVARAAAVELCEANPKWLRKLKACVTFGTPHDGSPLAEAPGDLLGKMVAIQAFRGGDGFFSLGDALHFVHQQKSIQGVLDLRPLGGGGEFLQDLLRREAKLAPDGVERALPVLAVGGKSADSGFFAQLSRRALAGTENDLIVETSSAATRYSAQSLVTQCNHFEYFRSGQAQADTFTPAMTFLKERLTLERQATPGDLVLETGRDITGGPLKLKKRHEHYTAAKPAAAS